MVGNFDKSDFRNSFKKIALPVALQQLFFISLNLVDSLMVGSLGQVEFNGVGLGGQYYFIVNLFIVGVASACTVYTTQFFGNNDLVGYRKSAGLGFFSCFLVGIIFGSVAIFFPDKIIEIFTSEAAIINSGAKYLRIIGFQIPFFSIIFPLSMASRAAQNAKLPLKISAISLSINTLLNYLLIFGNFGFPRLGVTGAAVATLSASVLSFTLYVLIISTGDSPLRAPIREFTSFSRGFVFKVFSTGWTIVLHEILWVFGISTYTVIISRFSSDSYSSYNIAVKFLQFAFVFTMAVSSTASITIGSLLGRKDIKNALLYEKEYSKTQILVASFAAFIVIGLSFLLINFYNVSDAIKENALYVSVVLSIFLPVSSYNSMQAAGILRAGGDTRVPVFYELFGTYFFNIPILFLLLKFSNLELPHVMFFASTGHLVSAVLLYKRVKKGNWANNLIDEKA